MLVEMNNMDFGEFIQIYDNWVFEKVLTIDCGSLNKRKFSYIVSKKLDFDTPIMISHLHDDHMNYFVKYSKFCDKKYKKVYLPCITTHNNGTGFVEILSDAILDLLIGKKSEESFNKNFLNKIKQISSIVDYENIEFLQRGDCRQLNSFIKMKVLWPCGQCHSNNNDNNKVNNDANAIVQHVEKKIIEKLGEFDINVEIDNVEYEPILNAIKEITLINYTFYNKRNNEADNVTIKELFKDKKWKEYNHNLNVLRNYQKENGCIYRPIENLTNINDLSIVCKITENYKSVLLTGDIDYSRVKKIAQNIDCSFSLENEVYTLCKIPHHGTENYIKCFKKVNANEFIVSNGNHKRFCIGNSINNFMPLRCTNGEKYCKCVSLPVGCCSNHLCMKGKTIFIRL